MSLRLYDYEASGNCYKVRLLLAQLEREYERVPVDIFAGDTLTEDYRAKNPALSTPVLELESGEHLAESGAILLYLAEGTDLLPADPAERAQVHRWMFFEQANIMALVANLRFRLLTGRLEDGSEEAEKIRRLGTGAVGAVEMHLAGREFVAGDGYTVADIALYGYLHVAHEAGIQMESFANLAGWLERVRAQPRHVADLMPYPENARPGNSKSLYDLLGI